MSAAPTPSASSATSADLSGRVLGDFQVLRRLGQGGMGEVYLAEQTSLRRRVALKILRADLAADVSALHRFRAEAEAVARASHANIVQVYATGEFAGLHYMALEYIQGRNLAEYLQKKGPPDLPLALSIMGQVAAALQRAGELGIIHRDIKPENILLTRKGEVKVADFGLSRVFAGDRQPLNLTQTGITMGTPLYMSPEQVEGLPLDPRSDIYSFGVTCYHMFAGFPPFRGENAFEVALKHVRAEPVPLGEVRPDLPSELCAIVQKMMAKDVARRYQTCRELLRDLAQLRQSLSATLPLPADGTGSAFEIEPIAVPDYLSLSGEEEPIPPDIPPEIAGTTPPHAPRRWRRLAAVGLGSVVLALAGGAALGWYRARTLPPPEEPRDEARPSDSAVEAIFSDKKREQFLLLAVEQYLDPGNDRDRLELGLRHCLELGLFYLKKQPARLEDADRFFQRLMENPAHVRAYAQLGRLGHAIVLAFQDRAAESTQLFLEVLIDARGPDKERVGFFLNNPQLRYWIARALNHNAANLEAAGQALPDKLKPLRQPPFPGPRRPT